MNCSGAVDNYSPRFKTFYKKTLFYGLGRILKDLVRTFNELQNSFQVELEGSFM